MKRKFQVPDGFIGISTSSQKLKATLTQTPSEYKRGDGSQLMFQCTEPKSDKKAHEEKQSQTAVLHKSRC